MLGTVALARRQQLADLRRYGAMAFIVGLAVMLILLLDGLWAGVTSSVTAYQRSSGADLYVAQRGVRNFLGASSQLPIDTVEAVRNVPGVEWAAPVRTYLAIAEYHGRKVPTAIVGWQPGEPGGPWVVREGRAPRADDEIAIGPLLVREHGLRVGGELAVLGRRFRIVGTSTDTFMISLAFMTHRAANDLLGQADTTSFVLVGTQNPTAVAAELAGRGFEVMDRGTLARNDLRSVTRAYQVPMNVMRGVAFAIGSVVVALGVYTSIDEHRRDYGIVKAMGASRGRLLVVAFTQSALVALAGLAAGGVLFAVGARLIVAVRPQFDIDATLAGAGRVVVATMAMALVAAVVPARQLARLEPAAAYRE